MVPRNTSSVLRRLESIYQVVVIKQENKKREIRQARHTYLVHIIIGGRI